MTPIPIEVFQTAEGDWIARRTDTGASPHVSDNYPYQSVVRLLVEQGLIKVETIYREDQ